MVGLPLLTFFTGGGVGGVAHLTQNNVALLFLTVRRV